MLGVMDWFAVRAVVYIVCDVVGICVGIADCMVGVIHADIVAVYMLVLSHLM